MDDIRSHVLDDAHELAATAGIVNPLLDAELEKSRDAHATARFLRALLVRHIALIVTRLHSTSLEGRTGITSIESLIKYAEAEGQISPNEATSFNERRENLKTILQKKGIPYKDLAEFRNAELAHSLHRRSGNSAELHYTPIWEFAHDTFELVLEIDRTLVLAGARAVIDLDDRFHVWRNRGAEFWSILPD